MAKYNFDVSGSQLIISLVPVLDDVQPTSMSYLAPSFKIGVGKINAYEYGQPRQSFLFTEIGKIDGVEPTDLQDAFDKLTTATANFNGGGASPPTYNFDLTSPNWASEGVTDEVSFINWLATRWGSSNLTNIVVTDFNFVGDRIFCNMTADGTTYDLSNLGLINADKIGVVNGLTILNLNQNQIVTFNPTIVLPSSLTSLYLGGNQIVTFNPTIPLPSSLTILSLSYNQIVTFNPTIALPSSLTFLGLAYNQMTLSGYTASEVWASAQPAFTNPCNVYFSVNTDSITGTNLEAILITKNCIIIS